MKPGWRGQYLRYKAYLLNTATQYKQRQDIRAYIEILLSLGTVTVFSIFALRPTLITIAGLIKDIESKKETISVMDKKIDDLAKAKDVYDSQLANTVLLKSAIPSESNPDELLRQIEGLASKNQVEIISSSIGESFLVGKGVPSAEGKKRKETDTLPTGANGLDFTVNLSGDYLLLAAFIKDMERMRRPVKIDNLAFSQKTDKIDSVLTLQITGRVTYVSQTASSTDTSLR
ncbi:hypothetical protein IPM62_00085 [Candidatus Woesebacteria bacterium]|nr:MAG: hypothetical protein IPM62_00085 [Candidatus Woesebacteria bacterium]